MALDIASLSSGLYALFKDPPDNIADCASAWADAMKNYTKAIDPLSTSVTTAAEALEPQLALAFAASKDFTQCNTLFIENAFRAWSSIISTGMVGAPSTLPPGVALSSTPPVGFPGFCDIETQIDHGIAALQFALKIDTWVRTGTAVIQITPVPPVTSPTVWK